MNKQFNHENLLMEQTVPPGFSEVVDDDGPFELVSAAWVNYLPSLPVGEHRALFQQLQLHRQLSRIEQDQMELLRSAAFEGDARQALDSLKARPAIICTMHTGSYRLLNLLLIREGIRFAVVMGTEVLQKEAAAFQKIYRQWNNTDQADLQLIDAEDGQAGVKMLRAIRNNFSLVLYMDGYSGAGERTAQNSNHCTVSFLHQQLYARKGIGYLAHVAGIPVLPVLSYRRSHTYIRLRFYPFIYPPADSQRDSFAVQTTRELHQLFAALIAQYPGQWEGWLHIHHVANIVNDTSRCQTIAVKKDGGKLSFNSFRFGIFKTAGLPVLLEKQQYRFYDIEEDLFRLLMRCKQQPIERSLVRCRWLEFALKKELLVPV